VAAVGAFPGSPSTESPAPTSTAPAPGTAPGDLPSRDELTKAWGDGILRGLSGRAKAYLGSGRFVEVDGHGAVFAVPDKHLLARCETVRGEAEAGLAAQFGRPVPLRLVVDTGAVPVERLGPPPWAEEPSEVRPEAFDVDELTDAASPVASPEQRLLDAFPGAEEVST
jgi:hypothetical protein